MQTMMAPRLTSGVKRLLIINIVAYVVYLVLLRSSLSWLAETLALSPEDVLRGQIWQPLTYMFIHSPFAISHLLMNMLMLFFFGGTVERMLGTRKLYLTYVLSGLGGALATMLFAGIGQMVSLGSISTMWSSTTLGASGAVYGVVLCWGAMQWNQRASFFLLGSMQIKTFIYILIGIELLALLSFAQGSSFTAHFGGMLTGFLLGRYGVPNFSALTKDNLSKVRAQAKHRKTQQRLSRFDVIEGGAENPNHDDTAGRPIWLHRSADDDDPIVH
jgi:membrane associated rhomboid family serine protease